MPRLAELAIVAGVAVLVLFLSSSRPIVHAAEPARPVTWRGLVGDGPRAGVDLGRQMIVVLASPSLADRVAAHGGEATEQQEQKWTSYALAQQRLLLSRLEVQGVRIQPEFSFGRVLAGFSALLDPTAVSLLERDHAVQGVYPVRVAYPSSISSDALSKGALASSVGNGDLSLPGYDGRGITIGLLDTGVDRTHPSLLGSLAAGVDIVDPEGDATPQVPPGRPSQIERHGTELAGILAGDRGPPASRGVARGASVLPIRVAGWQSDGRGGYAIYARTDQLIEGLERAVDPNTNGDAHDAVRVALVGVAAPYAGFADDPAARAIGGAVRLNTLVVTGAGNDGRAGPGFGSISGPGGGPAALTVGAADMRSHTQQVRVSLRVGLQVALDRMLPLSGESAPGKAFTSPITAPALAQGRVPFTSPHAYFTRNGLSLVAGRAALVPAGESPTETARSAARAGATAVLIYGARLPAGGVPLDEDTAVPVVSIPSSVAAKLVRAIATGRDAAASIGVPHARANHGAPSVAPFSSTGLAYDGRVKPDIVAPGVAIATATPGPAGDPVGSYTTVSGSSASAAAVAGAAAVLAEARPLLDAPALRSVLTGTARRLPSTAVTEEGAGLVALGGASAGELTTSPTTLAFGNARSVPWHRWQDVVVRNVSLRPLRVRVIVRRHAEGAALVRVFSTLTSFVLQPGKRQKVSLVAAVSTRPVGNLAAQGSIVLDVSGGSAISLPWVVTFVQRSGSVLGPLKLSSDAFSPSTTTPALLTFRAGLLVPSGAGVAVQPVSLLRLDLLDAVGNDLGTLATLRDLLPGRYAFGLTGRSSAGNPLGKGRYRVRVTAVPSLPGPPSIAETTFTIQ
jgi:subtilisin family serine protease